MSAQSAFAPPGSGALAACEQTWQKYKRNRWIVKLPLQNPEEVFWSLRIKITEKLFCCNSGLVRCCCEKQLWPFCWSLHHDHLETEARSLKWTHFPVSPKIIMLVAEWWHLRSCDHARAARGQEHILVTKWYFWSSWSQDQLHSAGNVLCACSELRLCRGNVPRPGFSIRYWSQNYLSTDWNYEHLHL